MTADDRSALRFDNAIAALVLAAVFFLGARTHADPDLWGHVRFGQDILAHGIPASDSYSYVSSGYRWINHEVLAEILFGAAFSTFGTPGLVSLKLALILIAFGLIYRHLARCGLDALRAGIIIVVVFMLMSVGLWTIRPQLFTYVFFLITVLLIERADKGDGRAAWLIPVVLLVWCNSHGGFLAGLGIVGLWFVASAGTLLISPRARPHQGRVTLTRFLVLAVSIAATLVNPYGPGLLRFLFRTATVARPEIGEWQPVSILEPEGIAYLAVVALCIAAIGRSARPRRPAMLAVLFATALLPLIAVRHLPLFGFAFPILAGEHIADVWQRMRSADKLSNRYLPPLLSWVLAVLFMVSALPYFSCIRIEPSFIRFPARAVGLIERAGVRANIATFFDWGEYMIWRLSPAVRVSVDGRRETVYSPQAYEESLEFLFGVGRWDAILENPLTDMALVGRNQPTYNLMKLKPGWDLVYEDSLSGLFVRHAGPQSDPIRSTPVPDLPVDGTGLCFP